MAPLCQNRNCVMTYLLEKNVEFFLGWTGVWCENEELNLWPDAGRNAGNVDIVVPSRSYFLALWRQSLGFTVWSKVSSHFLRFSVESLWVSHRETPKLLCWRVKGGISGKIQVWKIDEKREKHLTFLAGRPRKKCQPCVSFASFVFRISVAVWEIRPFHLHHRMKSEMKLSWRLFNSE